jgi:hypothetical protein
MKNDRDWIERTLHHQESEAVPYNFMFSPPAQRRAENHYGCNLEEAISFPLRMTASCFIIPAGTSCPSLAA